MAENKKALEVFERYETKYLLNGHQYENVLAGLLEYMNEDEYSTGKGGFYPICNIYYDTEDDRLIRKSIEKPFYKEKLRLRSYGNPDSKQGTAFLEIKKKYNKLVSKRRIVLPLGEAEKYMENGTRPETEVNAQILREMDYARSIYALKPKAYISYERKALYGREDPEFRLTFDRNITVRRNDLRLDSGNSGKKLLPDGVYLMEIKILDAMPMWCAQVLARNGVFPVSISKYGTEYLTNIAGKTLSEVIPEFFGAGRTAHRNKRIMEAAVC